MLSGATIKTISDAINLLASVSYRSEPHDTCAAFSAVPAAANRSQSDTSPRWSVASRNGDGHGILRLYPEYS